MPVKKSGGKSGGNKVLNFVAWLTGVIVSLAVGFALISGTLYIPGPYLGVVSKLAGYVVVITTAVGVILALLKK